MSAYVWFSWGVRRRKTLAWKLRTVTSAELVRGAEEFKDFGWRTEDEDIFHWKLNFCFLNKKEKKWKSTKKLKERQRTLE